MADKILSLESIKKCMEKIKGLLGKKADKTDLDVCVKRYERDDYDFNSLFDAGMYLIQPNSSNGPSGLNMNYGNVLVLRGTGDADTVAQIAVPYTNKISDIALRFGNINASDKNNIHGREWYYFHGSTSPNTPVIAKRYQLTEKISFESGKLGQRVFQEKIIVETDGYTPVCSTLSYVINSNKYNLMSFISGDGKNVYVNAYAATNDAYTDDQLCMVTVTFISNEYYQDTTTPASDEPEDDEGLSPQSYTTYEKPSETKQFHGESLYE